MFLSKLMIENFRCLGTSESPFVIEFCEGLTAIVGANDSGKTAVIDALRLALGTSDQERLWLEDSDFRRHTSIIRITCYFNKLNPTDKSTFVEYLTYGATPASEPILIINWSAEKTGEIRKGRPYRRIEVQSGKDGVGPALSQEIKFLLQTTYLRPLRDAADALSAGRGSRLAMVLQQTQEIKEGASKCDINTPLKDQKLSVLAIGSLLNDLLSKQSGVKATHSKIDETLKLLSLANDNLKSSIRVDGATAPDETRLRELLEKLDLSLEGEGLHGLGSDNLLFMACELLLIAQDKEGNKLLLIEEPEAHLHPQRQLEVMELLKSEATSKGIQIIITTHSPNLSSAISLENLVIIKDKCAFSLRKPQTKLGESDYGFLERFLDVTKANLFFAHGVMIVEGDAENILIPTLARIIGKDLTKHGVSIVNVGGIGLGRYARILQRNDSTNGELNIRTACISDMDIMPDCAPKILGKLESDAWPVTNGRKWRAKRDFTNEQLVLKRKEKVEKLDGQAVKSFISDEWTFEYDLALGPKQTDGTFSNALAEDIYVSAWLADEDEKIAGNKEIESAEEQKALDSFLVLKNEASATNDCSKEEVLASKIYATFAKSTGEKTSKPIAAQYLAKRLQKKFEDKQITAVSLREMLPRYLVNAIDYVTGTMQNATVPASAVPLMATTK